MHLQRHLLTTTITLALVSLIKSSFAEPYVSVTGYQITLPTGWTQSRLGGHTDIAFTGPLANASTPVIQVDVAELPSGKYATTLSKNVDELLRGEKAAPSFTQISRETMVIDGQTAEHLVITFRGSAEYPLLRCSQYIVPHGPRAYLTSMTCLDTDADTNQPIFDAVIQSFHFVSPKGIRFVSKYGYSFLPSANWTVYPGAKDKDVRVNEPGGFGFASNLLVNVTPMPTIFTAKAIYAERAELNKGFHADLPGSKLLSQTLTKAAGSPALDSVLTLRGTMDDGKPLRIRSHVVMIPRGKNLYTFVFTEVESRAKSQETQFRQMLNSIQWDKK